MSTTIKTYVGIFILLLSVFTMAGVMSACIDANNARDFHASVVAEIEDSNFAPSVINACKTQAANAGYELLIDESSIVKDEDGKPTLMEVILRYNYHVDFLGVISTQQIRAFARKGGFYEVDYRTIWKWHHLCHCWKWNGSHTDWLFKSNQQLRRIE